MDEKSIKPIPKDKLYKLVVDDEENNTSYCMYDKDIEKLRKEGILQASHGKNIEIWKLETKINGYPL